VLDLGEQPACDYFPRCDDPGPDPVYPLQMWLCGSCGLAQLVADPTAPEEPKGAEPAALVAQAADAVARVAARMVAPGWSCSPSGGSHPCRAALRPM
jgi:Putative zinc binding domain